MGQRCSPLWRDIVRRSRCRCPALPATLPPQAGAARREQTAPVEYHQEALTSNNEQSRVIGWLAVAATVAVALAACGTTTSTGPSSASATRAPAPCKSAYVDWLYLSGGVKCDEARSVASAIFMGDDGNEGTSFMKEDFAPLPTVRVAGVGYLPTRILGLWHCRYGTRRSSYDGEAGGTWLGAYGTLRLVYATCSLDARVVRMTTAMDHRPNRSDS
jgi:hypothetical protein